MKKYTNIMFAVFAAMSLLIGSFTYAEDAASTPSHEEHHPAKSADSAMGGKMGAMNMGDMSKMMGECMNMHKDSKMCDHEAMQKCQEHGKKGECDKMMKQSKMKDKAK